MVSTVFSDSIVSATELRNNQKQWLEKAFEEPITVSYGRKQLAIMNRERVGILYTSIHYSELILKACQEFREQQKSDVFPWIEYLSESDKITFHKEILSTTLKAIVTGKWDSLEQLISDWQATAMVEKSPEIAEELRGKEEPSHYINIEE